RGVIGKACKRSLPGLGAAQRLTGHFDVEACTFRYAWCTLGQKILLPARNRDRVATNALQPRLDDRPRADHSIAEDPSFGDSAVLDQCRAGLADPALDQPLRQDRIR